MTTITMEREDTGEHITAYQVRARIDELEGAATEAPVQIEPWIPRDPHARERCRCGEYHESALIAPASSVLHAEGSTVAAEMVRGVDHTPGWPTWLGDVHHADATWQESVADLHTWADSYTARRVERTVVQPVAVDYSYRQSEAALYAQMVVEAAGEHVASVYGPEYGGHIYDADRGFVPAKDSGEPSPPDDGWNRDAAFDGVKRHQPAAVAAVRADAPPTEPPAELGVHPEAASSVGGWRTWAASVALGVSAFGTLGSLLWLAGVL